MVTRKRKRIARYRGSKTHGWGAMKKHRGAGNRGGRGMAGTGKRGDAKKPSIWKNKRYFGKFGFGKKPAKKESSINLSLLDQKIDKWYSDKKIKTEKDIYIIDLESFGYEKVLGSGKITKKVRIKNANLSERAKEKIESIGGEVIKAEA